MQAQKLTVCVLILFYFVEYVEELTTVASDRLINRLLSVIELPE